MPYAVGELIHSFSKEVKMRGCIASPHWEACNTCRNHVDNGCIIKDIDLYVHRLGDWIICDNYENESGVAHDTKICANCNKSYPQPVGKDVCPYCGY